MCELAVAVYEGVPVDPLLIISPVRITVDPGGEARVQVTVRNPGDLVEQYRFQVLGEANRWAQVVPRDVSVMPGKAEEMTVDVVFRPPPAPAAPAGEVPFGVRCVSLGQQDDCAVVEGDVVVSAVLDLRAALVPVGAAGTRRGRFRLDLSNTGTLPISVAVTAVDDADLIRFALAPADITIPAGQRAPVFVAARPRTSKIVGKPVEHTIVVKYEVPGTDRAGQQQAVFQQQAVIPKWLIVLALVLGLIGAALLAWMVLRPGADLGPSVTPGVPPTLGSFSATAGEPGVVLLNWDQNPYATSYEVDLLTTSGTPADTLTVKAPKTAATWTGLPSGSPCFQLVPINDVGRGPASAKTCVTELVGAVEASSAAASESAQSASAESSSAASAAASSAAASSSSAAAASSSAAAAAAASSVAASSVAASSVTAAGSFTPKRWWVIYYRTPLADTALLNQAVQVQAALQAAGAPNAQLIDSTTLAKGAPSVPFWYVIGDNFADQAAALAECGSRNGAIPNVTSCTVQSPLTP